MIVLHLVTFRNYKETAIVTGHWKYQTFWADELKQILDFDRDAPPHKAWRWKATTGGNKAGDIAGCKGSGGWLIRVNSHQYNAQVLAYLWVNDAWPRGLKQLQEDFANTQRYTPRWDPNTNYWVFKDQQFKTEAEARGMTEEELRKKKNDDYQKLMGQFRVAMASK